MVRSLIVASLAALLLVGCGDDDGGGGGAAAPPQTRLPAGTVGGQPFVPIDGTAVVLGAATCSIEELGGAQASATGLVVGFGSFQGLCSLVTTTNGCGQKAGGTSVTVVIGRLNLAGGTAQPVGPGTYSVTPTSPPPAANVVVTQAFATKNDATCTASSEPFATAGSVRIDEVTAARVSGNVDLTFEDGSRLSGPFDVARCGFQPDACTALGGCATRACMP